MSFNDGSQYCDLFPLTNLISHIYFVTLCDSLLVLAYLTALQSRSQSACFSHFEFSSSALCGLAISGRIQYRMSVNPQRIFLKERKIYLDIAIDLARLETRRSSAKCAIPESCLFSIVIAFPPASSVVQVVILNDQLTSEIAKDWRNYRRRDSIYAQAGVAQNFFEEDVRLAYPPLEEWHRHPEAMLERQI